MNKQFIKGGVLFFLLLVGLGIVGQGAETFIEYLGRNDRYKEINEAAAAVEAKFEQNELRSYKHDIQPKLDQFVSSIVCFEQQYQNLQKNQRIITDFPFRKRVEDCRENVADAAAQIYTFDAPERGEAARLHQSLVALVQEVDAASEHFHFAVRDLDAWALEEVERHIIKMDALLAAQAEAE